MRALLEKPLHLGAVVALVLALAELSGLHALSGPEYRLMDALVRVQSRGARRPRRRRPGPEAARGSEEFLRVVRRK